MLRCRYYYKLEINQAADPIAFASERNELNVPKKRALYKMGYKVIHHTDVKSVSRFSHNTGAEYNSRRTVMLLNSFNEGVFFKVL